MGARTRAQERLADPEAIGEQNPQGVQHLRTAAVCDTAAVRDELRSRVLEQLGDAESGVVVIDVIDLLKNGTDSCGAAPQYYSTTGHWSPGDQTGALPVGKSSIDYRLTIWHNHLMKEDNRFMGELFRIISGALHLDIDKVRNYTAFLADKLERAGDSTSAARLRKMLDDSDHQLRPAGAAFSTALPVDIESRFPLIERVNLKGLSEPPMILSEEQWDTVHEFLSIAKSHAQVDTAAISLLIYGPPGTGKTRLARFIAQELGLDLYVSRLDGLISSFLGSTSKNIRALFEFAAKTPCILFLDEFDAIAKLRADTQELGELKRVVNSFIQNLDTLGTQSIVVAATNHEELLDSAIWRRFSYRLALDFPSAEQRRMMWVQFLPPLQFLPREIDLLVDLSDGFSGSDIKEVCLRLQRRRMMTQRLPELKEAFHVMQNMAIGDGEQRRFLAQLRGKDEHTLAVVLRERNAKLYSHTALAHLIGVSKATAYRRAKGVKSDV